MKIQELMTRAKIQQKSIKIQVVSKTKRMNGRKYNIQNNNTNRNKQYK